MTSIFMVIFFSFKQIEYLNEANITAITWKNVLILTYANKFDIVALRVNFLILMAAYILVTSV